MDDDQLKSYREKRNFSVTSEPKGEMGPQSEQIFVVQEHDARSLHYDLRMEVEGVLKSWAVPKGPPTNPKDKRLAIETEDHPKEYAKFEGTIPEGQYGAGTVIVWDKGFYRNLTEKNGVGVPMVDALKNGHASFLLMGEKLKGGFALTKTKRGWILIKMRDAEADASGDILKTEPKSVLSGRKLEDLS